MMTVPAVSTSPGTQVAVFSPDNYSREYHEYWELVYEALMKSDEIDNIFSYHAPHGNQAERYEKLRAEARSLAHTINELCPDSREKSLALTNLQTAVMMANAAIAIHD